MKITKHKFTENCILLRLLEQIKLQGKTEREVEKEIGLSHGAFSRWKYRNSKSYMQHIAQIADYLGVSTDYLLGTEKYKENAIAGTNEERQLLRMFRQLDDEERSQLMAAARQFTDYKSREFSPEEAFIRTWSSLLQSEAKVYIGLFTSLQRVADEKSRKPEKVIKEWSSRTRYRWESGEATELCTNQLDPAVETADTSECASLAKFLLKAAAEAGISPEPRTELILDETTVLAYTEWNSEEIYPGDKVKVITPAWYQNGQVLERGQCALLHKE